VRLEHELHSACIELTVHSGKALCSLLCLVCAPVPGAMATLALNECEESGGPVHIVLLGDSTLDNGRYLNIEHGELSVANQLSKRCLGRGWEMTLLAKDGSLLDDVLRRQLPRILATATHIVLSCTGNDLLALLNKMVVAKFALSSVYQVLGEGLRQVADQYRQLLDQLAQFKCYVACCTVYRPNFNHLCFKTLASFSLGMHNSRLMQIAEDFGSSVLDLANILEGDPDFANPLELSTRGGSKVVENITSFVQEHDVLLGVQAAPAGGDGVVHGQDRAVTACIWTGRCCTGDRPPRTVYASKAMSQALLLPDRQLATGTLLGSPLQFSEAQQVWRDV